MKVFRYLTALAAAALTFTACEKDAADLYATDPVAPVMDAHADVLLTKNSQEENISFTWKAARNLEGELLYTLYATSEAQKIQLTTTPNLYYTTKKDALRTQLLDGLKVKENNNFSMSLYVVADNGVLQVASEPITVNVFAYGEYVPAVVSLGADAQNGLVLSEDSSAELEVLTWEAARFDYGQSPRYKVEIQYGEGDRVVLADGLAATSLKMTPSALNTTLITLGCVKEQANEVKLIVTSTLEGENAPTLESAAVTLSVTPYTPSYPDYVLLCGDFGGHNWSTESNLPTLKGDANTGEYHGLVSFYGATYGMKVIYTHPKSQETVWVGVGASEDGVTYPVGNDDINPEAGSYVVYVNLAKNVMTFGKIESIGLIGGATELGWDGQTNFTYNETTGLMEIESVTLGEGAYKVRVNDNWGNPWEDPKAYNLGGDPNDMTFGGSDITAEPGVYKVTMNLATNENYKLNFEKTGDVVIEDPLTKNYGLVGTINEWGSTPDIAMILAEGEEYVVAKSVEMPADNMFKIRVDSDWTENYGAAGDTEPAVVTVGSKSALVAGGKNMTIAAGTYDIYYYPKTKELIAVTAGEALPAAEYALIGKFNEWTLDTQVVMTEANNGYVVAKNVTITGVDIPDNGFNVKENVANWDNSWGSGTVLELGVATATTHNGGNMGLAAEGAYDIYFNPTTLMIIAVTAGSDDPTGGSVEPAPTSEQIEVGLIGIGGNWDADGDVKMTQQADGSYYAENVAIKASDTFKVRKAGTWDDKFNWGLATAGVVADGVQTDLICGGGSQNISVAADGTYNVTFYPTLDGTKVVYNAAAKIKVEKVQESTPTPSTGSVWDATVWGPFFEANGSSDKNANFDFGNGLQYIANGTKIRFAADAIQVRGTGDLAANKGLLQLTVSGPGSLEIDISSNNDNGEKDVAIVLDGTEIARKTAHFATTVGRTVYTIDCSAAKAGSVINVYSTDGAYMLYVMKWTPGEGGSTPAPTPTALATPVVTLDPASVEAGTEKAVAVAWAAVENAANYDVVFNGGAAVNVTTNAYTIDAATVKALAKGEYKVSVVAKPADAAAYTESAAGEATLTVTEAATPSTPATPLEWGNDIFKNFFETLSGSDKNTEITQDVDFGNGLKFIAGSGKCKFGSDSNMYRIQYGGSGDFDKQTLALTVSGPGTLELTIRSSNKTEARKLGVWIDQVQVHPEGGYDAPMSGESPQVHTIDCSAAKAGSVINFHCLGSGINVYNIKWTPKQ